MGVLMVLSSCRAPPLKPAVIGIGLEGAQTLLKTVRTKLHVVQTLLQAVGTKV